MAVYQLTLFYPNLKAHAATVQQVRAEIEAIAGKNWRVLSAGEQVCALGFVTDKAPEQWKARLERFGSEQFLFLLAEIAAAPTGYLTKDVWQWLASRLPAR